MKTFLRSSAVTAAAALTLTACGGGGGGTPSESVASALDARFTNGASFTLSLDGDVSALAEAGGEDLAELEALANGTITGAIGPEGDLAFTMPEAGVEVRFVDDALYVQLDVATLTSLSPEMGDPSELQQLAQAAPPDLAGLVEAALAGEWVGVTGLSPEALQEAAGSFGMTETDTQDLTGLQEALEEQGLTDGTTMVEEYLIIEGDGPEYDVTLRARALAEALNEVAATVEEAAAGAGVTTEEMDPADVPEEIGGVQLTVEDETLTEIRLDFATLGAAIEGDAGGLSEGDVALVITLDEVGDQLSVPDGATTVTFDALLEGVMGALFSGGLSG